MKYDFSGYATKNDLRCADGRVIRRGAFKANDGVTVPLVWQHNHMEPDNILGHAILENRDDGVYAYGVFNNTPQGQNAKELVKHGDITSMSIYANKLKQQGHDVIHGLIREVSLVIAPANPGALIDNVCIAHSDGYYENLEDEAVIYTGLSLQHADDEDEEDKKKPSEAVEESEEKDETPDKNEKDDEMADDKTVKDVVDSMTDEQRTVLNFLVGKALEENQNGGSDEEDDMKHNIFECDEEGTYLTHADVEAAFAEAKTSGNGSLKDAFLAHGIEDIDVLFPEAKTVTPTPEMISRDMTWVNEVWNGTRKTPFARIKSTAANITADEARAKGYIKGNKKVEEQLKLLKRSTTPQTVYKLQKLDRDDIIDITDIDVVAWLKAEMRMMLDEELARAILVGDGRSAADEDKIKEDNIRPIYQDDDMYTIHYEVAYDAAADTTEKSNALVEAALRARKDYKGSGNPTMYACTDIINDMLLATDKIGHRLYKTTEELATALRVKAVVEVPILEGVTREEDSKELLALIVNLNDYTIGADKGGAVSLFDDFDLNYNKYEYLIETRCSGALYKPYSAIALEQTKAQG